MNYDHIFFAQPEALKRLGKDQFLEVPLYRSQKTHKAIYINEPLFTTLLRLDKELPWAEKANILEYYFSTAIDPSLAGSEHLATVYVDRQADPLGLSLSGNLGSGRAYYLGKYFNVKGEKTSLAVSELEKYSNGLLEIERGIWETITANALQNSLETGLCQVLAILDIGDDCNVPWRHHPVRRVKIIRVDQSGELDRLTHIFYNKSHLNATAMIHAASQFGKLEADKFAERILHGAWSAGNISPKGHCIDFDTVAAVKGRIPQYSFSKWHAENYFGYEYKGQLKLLEALCNDTSINFEGVKYSDLKNILLSTMEEQLAERLVSLMGFSQRKMIYARFKQDLLKLAILFTELSRKCLPAPYSFFAKKSESLLRHFYDFSSLFKVFPLYKHYEVFSYQTLLDLGLINLNNNNINTLEDMAFSTQEKEYLFKNVFSIIKDDLIMDQNKFDTMKGEILNFIERYDRLFSEILQWSEEDIHDVEVAAYKINEDRLYLFAFFALSYTFSCESHLEKADHLSLLISTLIQANSRSCPLQWQSLPCDMRLYREGIYQVNLLKHGLHTQSVALFLDKIDRLGLNPLAIEIFLFDEGLPTTMQKNDKFLTLTSYPRKNNTLLMWHHRESFFISPKIRLSDGHHSVELKNYIDFI